MCLVLCNEVISERLFEDEVAEAVHQVIAANDVQVAIVALYKSADTEWVSRADEVKFFAESLEHITPAWDDVIGDEFELLIELA